MFVLTEKQKELMQLISTHKYVLADGGSRSGKSLCLLHYVFTRAVRFQNTNHLICRLRLNHIRQSVVMQSVPQLSRLVNINYDNFLNKSALIYMLPNGSNIFLAGLDDKERTEKILGNEFATIDVEESSQISYSSVELLATRLNAPIGIKGKMLFSCNPPSKMHWNYKIFYEGVLPNGEPLRNKNEYAALRMNPTDNPNLSKDYLDTLNNLSLAKRQRFLYGEYSDGVGNLWRRDWIKYQSAPLDLIRIVVGVDPAGGGSNDVGIIVCAKSRDGHYYVLDDFTINATPAVWANEVLEAYKKYKADVIVAERNFGGDMVESTIKMAGDCNVKMVTSTRGKIIRAEPISALYEQGKVFHTQVFEELEDEMLTYDGQGGQESPNRLDALVFAMAELSGESIGIVPAAFSEGLKKRRQAFNV
jgi:PBSX family phage terminase large subunit